MNYRKWKLSSEATASCYAVRLLGMHPKPCELPPWPRRRCSRNWPERTGLPAKCSANTLLASRKSFNPNDCVFRTVEDGFEFHRLSGASLNWVGERGGDLEVEAASHPIGNGLEVGEVAEAPGAAA